MNILREECSQESLLLLRSSDLVLCGLRALILRAIFLFLLIALSYGVQLFLKNSAVSSGLIGRRTLLHLSTNCGRAPFGLLRIGTILKRNAAHLIFLRQIGCLKKCQVRKRAWFLHSA